MTEDEMYAALVPALLDIEGIPDIGELGSMEAEHVGTALLPTVRRIVADELRAAAYDCLDFTDELVAAWLRSRADALDPPL